MSNGEHEIRTPKGLRIGNRSVVDGKNMLQIRLVLEGEDRIFMNYEIIQGKWMPSREDREYREEILEGVDEAVSTLERMISEERVEELLSTLTDLQRKVVHTHLFHGLSFTEAAKHLGMTRQNLTGIYNAAIYKIQKKHFRALCS